MLDSPIHNVWINARFLDRPVTGVERVARETIDALVRDHLNEDGLWHHDGKTFAFQLIAPATGDVASPWPQLPLRRTGGYGGHAWEQTTLAWHTKGDWLINLCNTGPLLKRRQLLFLHDAQPFVVPDNFSRAFGAWYRVLYRCAGRASQRLMVNSEFTLGELVKHAGLDPEKATLCYPGVEHLTSVSDPDAKLNRHALPDEPFVLAVSSANPNKNFASVVEAVRLLGDAAPPMVIVGQRHQAQFSEVEIRSERIRHLGYVTDEELVALYQRAGCLVFPSFYEGFGLPPVEAMVNGCPVIATNTGAVPEICGDAAMYIDPHCPQTLADAMQEMLSDANVRDRFRAAGYQNIKRFRWSGSANGVLDALSQGERERVVAPS